MFVVDLLDDRERVEDFVDSLLLETDFAVVKLWLDLEERPSLAATLVCCTRL